MTIIRYAKAMKTSKTYIFPQTSTHYIIIGHTVLMMVIKMMMAIIMKLEVRVVVSVTSKQMMWMMMLVMRMVTL